MNRQEMMELFKVFEEKHNYALHADVVHRDATIDSLLDNAKKYGYPVCPCRLATGNKEEDADIVCPCEYCVEDVEECGACYCLLFVKKEFADNPEFYPDIDERRPADKVQ